MDIRKKTDTTDDRKLWEREVGGEKDNFVLQLQSQGEGIENRREKITLHSLQRTLFSRKATVKGSLVKIPGSLFGEDQVTTLKRSLSL